MMLLYALQTEKVSAGRHYWSYKNANAYGTDEPILDLTRVFKAAKVHEVVYILLCYTVALGFTRHKTFYRPRDSNWVS
jgi:hypothetical protein